MISLRPPIRPKQRRSIAGESMTIAAGFTCTDGILICADTEHTGADSKFDRSKVSRRDFPFCSYGITGSGNSSYLGMAADILEEAVAVNTAKFTSATLDESEVLFIKILRNMAVTLHRHIKSCVPPPGYDYPTIELIVGVRLYKGVSEKLTLVHIASDGGVSRMYDSVFVGTGAAIATNFARILLREVMSLDLMRTVALFIVFQAKLGASFCGGGTHSYHITSNSFSGSTWVDDYALSNKAEDALRLILIEARDDRVSEEDFQKRLVSMADSLRDLKRNVINLNATRTLILEEIKKGNIKLS